MVKILIPIVLMVLIASSGCSTARVEWFPAEPNGPGCVGGYVLEGQAAESVAESIAQNILDDQGMKNQRHKYDANLYVGLVGLLVAGLVFWGLTRSKWGWVIPAAAIGGLAFVDFWPQYGKWVVFGVVGLAVGLLIVKAREYQRERNINMERSVS